MTQDDWLPLTAAQQGLYFAHLLAPDSPAGTTAEVVEIAGDIDPDVLGTAVARTHQDFEQLRTIFRSTAHGPEQAVIEGVGHPWTVLDLSAGDEPAVAAESWLRERLATPLDPATGAVVESGVIRLGTGQWWWWHLAHHVVCDGYGAIQIVRRVAEHYAHLVGPGASPSPVGTRLRQVVAEDARVRSAEVAAGAAEFWDRRLGDAVDVVSLAGQVQGPEPVALRAGVEVSEELQSCILQAARRLSISWADLVQVAIGTYLARCRDLDRTRIGTPLMNRSRAGDGALASTYTVCTAMNVLPATVLAGSATWGESLAAFTLDQQMMRTHPFERQERLNRLAEHRGGQLFGATVNLVPFSLDVGFGAATGTVRNLTAGPVEDLTLTLRGTPGRRRVVRLEVDANPALYGAEEAREHLDRLLHWLRSCAEAEAGTRISDLSLLGPDEEHLVLETFNDTSHVRSSATLAQRFASRAERSGHDVALIDGIQEVTYLDLRQRVDRLARALLMAGVHPGDVVGVLVPRSVDLFVALHAAQRVGAVHLPLDADQPFDRLAQMLADAGSQVLLVPEDRHACAEVVARLATQVPGLLPLGVASSAPQIDLGPVPSDVTAPAYLLFTSGSTGRPKGVLVSHEAIDNRLAWMQHEFPISTGDRVLHKTPITFDVSVWEHFWAFQVGATVVVAPPGTHRDPREIARLVTEHHVTVLHFVPSMLRAFLADRISRQMVRTAGVRHLVCSGEALTHDLVAGCHEWFGIWPANLYGPTEAAVDVTCQQTEDLVQGAIPIGRPIWNTRAYVLDRAGSPVPRGATGELYLGGIQVALGYLNRPELDAERFVEDPFVQGGRMYATGDLARWNADGTLFCLGRVDDQVKVRGQRVELGEIEAAFSGVPGARAVAAGLVGAPDAAQSLALWFVASNGIDPEALRLRLMAAATGVLAQSLRPSHWIEVNEIPLSTAGKIDRRRLAATVPVPSAQDDLVLAPSGLAEQRLCQLVARVLELRTVGPEQDFFALGGDSLRVLALVGEIEDTLGVRLEVRHVFEHPTPSGLARLLAHDPPLGNDFAELLTLRPGAAGVAPLVLLPPAGGLGWCYTSLLRHLPVQLPVLTVQAPGLDQGAPEPVVDLAALAERQLKAIRTVVGDGLFHVAGWSLGGMAAHEVAALAQSRGQRVGAVVLLDAYPAEQWAHLSQPSEAAALLGVLRMGGVDPREFADPDHTESLTRERAVELLRVGGSALARLPDPILAGSLASVIEAARVVRTSTHRRLQGDLHVVVATEPRPEHWLDASGWEAHTTGAVRHHPVASTHGDLVRPGPADRVGALLSDLVGRADAEVAMAGRALCSEAV